jgi:hypothetical protein
MWWDDPDSRRALPLLSFLFVVVGVSLLSAADWVVGIAAVVVAAAMAINVFYFRALDAAGTVRPFVARARGAADAGYFFALVRLPPTCCGVCITLVTLAGLDRAEPRDGDTHGTRRRPVPRRAGPWTASLTNDQRYAWHV